MDCQTPHHLRSCWLDGSNLRKGACAAGAAVVPAQEGTVQIAEHSGAGTRPVPGAEQQRPAAQPPAGVVDGAIALRFLCGLAARGGRLPPAGRSSLRAPIHTICTARAIAPLRSHACCPAAAGRSLQPPVEFVARSRALPREFCCGGGNDDSGACRPPSPHAPPALPHIPGARAHGGRQRGLRSIVRGDGRRHLRRPTRDRRGEAGLAGCRRRRLGVLGSAGALVAIHHGPAGSRIS